MDPRGLKDEPGSKNDCYTHECEHFRMLMKFQWKVKWSLKSKPRGGSRNYHAEHAARHLKNHCDEADRLSIQQRLIE